MSLEEELRRLAAFRPRDDWNEITVREEILAPLLRALGYQKDTDYDINREKHLLVHPFLMRGSERVKIDYAVLVRRQHFWILEAKRPSSSLDGDAIHQAYFYAIHPEVQARFFAVCDGREFRLFDVRNVDEHYIPILQFALPEIEQHFPRLRDVIGSGKIRDEVAARAIADLRKVVQTEIRRERLDGVERDLRQLVVEAREAVEKNVRDLWRRQMEEHDEEVRTMFPKNSPVQIARVAFEFVDTAHEFDVVFDVLRQKLMALPAEQLAPTIRDVVRVLDGDLVSGSRLHVMQALLRLLPDLKPPLVDEVRARLREEIRKILLGFPEDERPQLLWRIEGLVKRVPYKVSVVRGNFTKGLEAIVEKKRATLPEEKLVVHPPSIWGERYAWSTRQASDLFHRFATLPTAELVNVIADLDRMEADVEPTFLAATKKGVDGESEPPTFVYFDRHLDCYRSVLFNVLLAEFAEALPLVGDDELSLVEDLLRRVKQDAYYLNHADVFWVRAVHARGGMDRPIDPESGKPLTDDQLTLLMGRPTINRLGISAVEAGVRIWGQIGEARWAEYSASLNFGRRRVEVSDGKLRR